MQMGKSINMLQFHGVVSQTGIKSFSKKGHHSTYEASLAGGSDKFKYYSSLSYMKQNGIVQGSGLERVTGV